MVICEHEGVVFLLAEDPAVVLQAKELHYDVYLEYGYVDKSHREDVFADEKNEISDFIVAIDCDGQIIGTMRLTPPTPTLHVFESWKDSFLPSGRELAEKVNGSLAVELGALAVKREMQKRKISWGLYKATFLYSLRKEIEYWVIAMDNRALRALEMLGWYVERIGDSIEYMGSPSTLGIMPVSLQGENIEKKNRKYHRFIFA